MSILDKLNVIRNVISAVVKMLEVLSRCVEVFVSSFETSEVTNDKE